MNITDNIKVKMLYLGWLIQLTGRDRVFIKKGEKRIFTGSLANDDDFKLVLKPLSSLTEQDATEIASILNENPKHIIACFNGQPEYKKGPDEKKIKFFIEQTIVYQFLQSRGYDLPQYLLGNKTLKEAGLAVYE